MIQKFSQKRSANGYFMTLHVSAIYNATTSNLIRPITES